MEVGLFYKASPLCPQIFRVFRVTAKKGQDVTIASNRMYGCGRHGLTEIQRIQGLLCHMQRMLVSYLSLLRDLPSLPVLESAICWQLVLHFVVDLFFHLLKRRRKRMPGMDGQIRYSTVPCLYSWICDLQQNFSISVSERLVHLLRERLLPLALRTSPAAIVQMLVKFVVVDIDSHFGLTTARALAVGGIATIMGCHLLIQEETKW